MIQIGRLEGFFWVARTGGYARAARAFPYPISQPAVHQQVRKLEQELGTALFERIAKDRMQLTSSGKHLYKFIAPFFEGLPAVTRAIERAEHGGEIHIHAAPMVLRDLLPPWVKRIRKRLPKAQVHLHETRSPDLDALRRGEADLVLSYVPTTPRMYKGMVVGTLHGHLVVPKGHRLAKRERVTFADLEGETFVGYTHDLLAHTMQMNALMQAGVSPKNTLSADTAGTILAIVEAGLGVSAIATVNPTGPKGRGVVALRLTGAQFDFPITAVHRKNAPANPALRAALATAPTLL